MALFGVDYEKAGAGVDKNAPKKKAFFAFFELFFRKFGKMIQLSIITFLFSIPIITIGPAIAGMTKVLRGYVIEKSTFMFHDFWKGFSKNLKLSLPVGIADVIICISTALALKIYPQLANANESTIYIVLCVISVSAAFTLLIMNFYIFPMIISTDLSLLNIIKNSFYLTCIGLKKNVITLFFVLLTVVSLTIGIIMHIFMALLIPFGTISFVGLIIVFNTYPMIQKYVIDPYYEERGEVNPEYGSFEDTSSLFMDKGGHETPIEAKNKKNKVIS